VASLTNKSFWGHFTATDAIQEGLGNGTAGENQPGRTNYEQARTPLPQRNGQTAKTPLLAGSGRAQFSVPEVAHFWMSLYTRGAMRATALLEHRLDLALTTEMTSSWLILDTTMCGMKST